MQDGIIKGTGNSRYLKSIAEFLTQYPTYNDFAAALAAGTLPIDLNGINPTGWDQQGTPLNKENLLSDETCELLGITQTSVPDDAFLKISKFLLRPGSVFWFAGETAPNGFLICDGSLISRVNYSDLFSVIGIEFGSGDGSTTFALPDLRAKFIRGAGSSDGYSASFGNTEDATSLRYVNEHGSRYNLSTYAPTSYDKRETVESEDNYFFDDTYNLTNLTNYRYYFQPYNIALTPIIKY